MDSEELKGGHAAPKPRRCSRLTLILLGVLFAAIAIGLGVGLGVGLTRHNMGAGSSTPSSSSSAEPTSSVTPSQNGVWQPPVNASWQIVLQAPLNLDLNSKAVTPDVDVWDIDLFTNSNETIRYLSGLGKNVVCYFSAGSYEGGRPDSHEFNNKTDLGKELDGWPGEYWLNVNSQNVRDIMANRIQRASEKGCHGIDPDNVDGFANDNGVGLTKNDSINYIKFLSQTAAQYNISIGLKNAGSIIPDVLNYTAFSVNEQCYQYSECATFAPFIQAGKPVFHIEYPRDDDTNSTLNLALDIVNPICSTTGNATGSYDFSTIIKNMNLDGWAEYCNGQDAVTPVQGSS